VKIGHHASWPLRRVNSGRSRKGAQPRGENSVLPLATLPASRQQAIGEGHGFCFSGALSRCRARGGWGLRGPKSPQSLELVSIKPGPVGGEAARETAATAGI